MDRGPLKARHASPQNKGGVRMTSMLRMTDNKPGLIPLLFTKRPACPGIALLVHGTTTYVTWLSEPRFAIHPL